jgi:hypothetical protein
MSNFGPLSRELRIAKPVKSESSADESNKVITEDVKVTENPKQPEKSENPNPQQEESSQ